MYAIRSYYGTVAFNIFLAIIGIWLLYVVVNMLKMKLLSSILGTIIGGGAIALIILFQQEIRRFLILLGTKYFPNKSFSLVITSYSIHYTKLYERVLVNLPLLPIKKRSTPGANRFILKYFVN